MEHHKLTIPILIVLSLTSIGAAQTSGLPIENVEMVVGEIREINLSVENQLPLQDKIQLTFKGRAVSNSLVQIRVEENGNINCTDDFLSCNVTVPARSTERIGITLEASQTGQEELILEGTSTETQLTGQDTLTISTNPLGSQGQVSAPGITAPYIAFVAGIAGILLFFYTRNQ